MTCLQQSPQSFPIASPRTAPCFVQPFDEGLDALKERQLVFNLVRQLAQAQFVLADRQHSEALWQEAAAMNLDPDRIIRLLYGCHDYEDVQAMEAIDRVWRQEARQGLKKAWRRPAWLGGRRTAKQRGASRNLTACR